MPTEVPYAADAEMSLTYDELEVISLHAIGPCILLNEHHLPGFAVTIPKGTCPRACYHQTKFNYAWGLVKSPIHQHQVEGVKLLQDIYRTEPARRRECLYYLALGYYKMGNFEEARKFNSLLMEKEPSNMQAQSLDQLIQKGAARDGYIGMAIVGGAAALGTLLVAGLIRRARK